MGLSGADIEKVKEVIEPIVTLVEQQGEIVSDFGSFQAYATPAIAWDKKIVRRWSSEQTMSYLVDGIFCIYGTTPRMFSFENGLEINSSPPNGFFVGRNLESTTMVTTYRNNGSYPSDRLYLYRESDYYKLAELSLGDNLSRAVVSDGEFVFCVKNSTLRKFSLSNLALVASKSLSDGVISFSFPNNAVCADNFLFFLTSRGCVRVSKSSLDITGTFSNPSSYTVAIRKINANSVMIVYTDRAVFLDTSLQVIKEVVFPSFLGSVKMAFFYEEFGLLAVHAGHWLGVLDESGNCLKRVFVPGTMVFYDEKEMYFCNVYSPVSGGSEMEILRCKLVLSNYLKKEA